MSNYDNYEENRYDDFDEDTEILSSDTNYTTPMIDSAAIANSSANAINGPNGQEFCRTIRYAIGVIGILGLTWLFEGGRKA